MVLFLHVLISLISLPYIRNTSCIFLPTAASPSGENKHSRFLLCTAGSGKLVLGFRFTRLITDRPSPKPIAPFIPPLLTPVASYWLTALSFGTFPRAARADSRPAAALLWEKGRSARGARGRSTTGAHCASIGSRSRIFKDGAWSDPGSVKLQGHSDDRLFLIGQMLGGTRPFIHPSILSSNCVEFIPWERSFMLEPAPGRVACWRTVLCKGLFAVKMKRNHDYTSSDSDLDDSIEVERESVDENG